MKNSKEFLKNKKNEFNNDADYIQYLEDLLTNKYEVRDATFEKPSRVVEIEQGEHDLHLTVSNYVISLQNYDGDFEISIENKDTLEQFHSLQLPCDDN